MRIKVTLAYDGSKYCGWQIQPNGISIQGVVEKVISETEQTGVCQLNDAELKILKRMIAYNS